MNFLWEVSLAADRQGIGKQRIVFRMAERFSPYMEVSCPCLNQRELEEAGEEIAVEVNPYCRFYDIFKHLYHPEMREYHALRKSLTNLIFHQLAENDVLSGMTREEYYKKLLYRDFLDNRFGAAAKSAIGLFDRSEREILLSGLLRQYQTGSSLDVFKDMLEELIDDNILYRSNDDPYELMIYIGRKRDRELAAKVDFLIEMFVGPAFRTEIYYGNHFGIIGVGGTMEIDEIAVC